MDVVSLKVVVYTQLGGREIHTCSSLCEAVPIAYEKDADRIVILEYPDGKDEGRPVCGLELIREEGRRWRVVYMPES
ncbi:MAG: hypothetical protein A3J67_00540 [Parcubacteria group bacterium RIFCSPHIGHO2_02_FULL_48_10b]|nr:MAG: hypothetical protein A3J67_00540 [Parcubacteria group bacterium RIFCSPHIGHO2_02_FULL_48_10b]